MEKQSICLCYWAGVHIIRAVAVIGSKPRRRLVSHFYSSGGLWSVFLFLRGSPAFLWGRRVFYRVHRSIFVSLYPYKVGGSLFRLGVFGGVALLRAIFRSTGGGIGIGCSFDDFYIFPCGHHYWLPAQYEAEQYSSYKQGDCVKAYECVHFCDFPFFVFHNNEFWYTNIANAINKSK